MPKALRALALSPGSVHVSIFWVLSFVFYVAALVRSARRIGRLAPDEAQAELLRVAGFGFVLVYFALEMP